MLLPSSDSKNVLISAFADPPVPASAASLRERAAALQAKYDIPMVKWVHELQRANRTDAQSLIG